MFFTFIVEGIECMSQCTPLSIKRVAITMVTTFPVNQDIDFIIGEVARCFCDDKLCNAGPLIEGPFVDSSLISCGDITGPSFDSVCKVLRTILKKSLSCLC